MQLATTRRPRCSDRILDAAEAARPARARATDADGMPSRRVLAQQGGLLYHYPSKDALLVAMLERYCARSTPRCELARAGLAQDDGAGHLKSMVIGMLRSNAVRGGGRYGIARRRCEQPSLLVRSAAHTPRPSPGWRRTHARSPATAIVTLAVDGLMMVRSGGYALHARAREQIVASCCGSSTRPSMARREPGIERPPHGNALPRRLARHCCRCSRY